MLELGLGFMESPISCSVFHNAMQEGTALCSPLPYLPELISQGFLESVMRYEPFFIPRMRILNH